MEKTITGTWPSRVVVDGKTYAFRTHRALGGGFRTVDIDKITGLSPKCIAQIKESEAENYLSSKESQKALIAPPISRLLDVPEKAAETARLLMMAGVRAIYEEIDPTKVRRIC